MIPGTRLEYRRLRISVLKSILHDVEEKHTKVIRDKIKCLRVILHLRVQTRKVEPVKNIVLLHLAEVFIALR